MALKANQLDIESISLALEPDITTKTNTYTATINDKFISASTSSPWTLTLYTTVGNTGKIIEIIKTSNDLNALTIDANGSETINGSTTFKLNTQFEYVKLFCDGTNWFVIEHRIPSFWTDYTPTGTWTTNTTYTGKWLRINRHVLFDITVSTTGTPNATFLAVNLPTGITLDISGFTTTNNFKVLGSGSVIDSGSSAKLMAPTYNTTSQLLCTYFDNAATGLSFHNVTESAPTALGSGDSITFRTFPLLVSGWEG